MTAPEARIETALVTSADALALLRAEWDDLAARADCHASDMFAWVQAGWECVAEPRQGALRVILARKAGQLVGVWPLVRYPTQLGNVLWQLGAESSEYADILAAPGPDAEAIGRAAWQVAVGLGDLLILRLVRAGSLLDRVARSGGYLATRDRIPAPWICFDDYPDFAAFMARVNKDRRATLRRARRHLGRKGAVEFAMLEDPAERRAAVDWALARKNEWLAGKGLHNSWIVSARYRAFLHRLAGMGSEPTPLRIFVLRLDGRLIAVLVSTIDRTWVEFYIISNDPAWARFSPGTLLLEDSVAWAYAHGLQFDFRIGDERYKASWANRHCNVTTFHIALTWRGAVAVGLEAARLRWVRGRAGYRRTRAWVITHLLKPWVNPLRAVLRYRAEATR
jgi:CelD/BcsL family acetyltransferase involved in cellulose biosynthesis